MNRQWPLTLLLAALVAIAGCSQPKPAIDPEVTAKASVVHLGLTGGGVVEADETYWGNAGKQRKGARGYAHKMKVVSLVERGGEKRSVVVNAVNAKTLRIVLESNVSKDANLMTDEHSGYTLVGREFASHGVTRHTAGQYVDGNNHSNTVESSFSLLKRGLIGTFHHVGEQHLQRYVTEFDFRWNRRSLRDAERVESLLGQVAGKRLMYRDSLSR